MLPRKKEVLRFLNSETQRILFTTLNLQILQPCVIGVGHFLFTTGQQAERYHFHENTKDAGEEPIPGPTPVPRSPVGAELASPLHCVPHRRVDIL